MDHLQGFAESRLDDDVHIGNFVEIKKTEVGKGTKINHLSYVGDSTLGKNINIGAGTITCNYDGANKHKTIIEDDVFIGSDTQLVAPVIVKKGQLLARAQLSPETLNLESCCTIKLNTDLSVIGSVLIKNNFLCTIIKQ